MIPLVSVIIPIYNTESYLPRCLDSISKQSLADIEIILVDDASTDKCRAICNEYANQDARFRYFRCDENCGPAKARNIGISMAAGDYLMFVDSDDWVHIDYCRVPYETAIHFNSDLVMFGFKQINMFGIIKKNYTRTVPSGYKSRIEAIEVLLNYAGNGPCNKLFKKSLFYNLFFPEHTFYEDTGFIYKLVYKAVNVYCIDRVLYFCCYRPGSITTLKTEKALNDWVKMHMLQYNDLSAWGYYPAEKLDLLMQNIAMEYCIKKNRDLSDPEYIFFVEKLFSSGKIPKAFSWKRKLLFLLLKYYPALFEHICVLWGKKFMI